jgi:hypothetical protein
LLLIKQQYKHDKYIYKKKLPQKKKKNSKALSTDPYKKTETNLSIPFQIGSERECQHHRMYVNNWAYQTI